MPEIDKVKGIPGHSDSSYLVFSLITVSSASLEREFFEDHRVVAFASQYALDSDKSQLSIV